MWDGAKEAGGQIGYVNFTDLLVVIGAGSGQTSAGTEWGKKYTINHALGGKNAFYFLTLMSRGKLQTLPLAYDVRNKSHR